jgi:hypothetical protein
MMNLSKVGLRAKNRTQDFPTSRQSICEILEEYFDLSGGCWQRRETSLVCITCLHASACIYIQHITHTLNETELHTLELLIPSTLRR